MKISTKIYRIQTCNSILCGYLCIGFINFMLKGKKRLNNTKIFLMTKHFFMKRFVKRWAWTKSIVLSVISIDETFKEEESTEILRICGLINNIEWCWMHL